MTNEAEGSGSLPQSDALAEAKPESIADLFSRDPEGFSRQDDIRIVEAFRAQRVRWEQAEALEAAGGKKKREKTKAEPGGAAALLKRKAGEPVTVQGNLEDLGL